MFIYFSDSQIPELKILDGARRQWLKGQALKAVKRDKPWVWRLPLLLGIIGTVIGWLALPLIVQVSLQHSSMSVNGLLSLVGSGAGGIIGNFVGEQLLIRALRPYLRRMP
jgi:hypothetical protein